MNTTSQFVLCLCFAAIVGCQEKTTLVEKPAMTPVAEAVVAAPVSESDSQDTAAPQSTSEKKGVTENDPTASEETVASEETAASEKSIARSQETESGQYNELGVEASFVLLRKGTQPRSDGGYTMTHDPGTYICRQCNAMLYRSEDKFDSHCGWPSFDDEIKGAISRNIDADGYRVEIVCANCGGHLGHVFEGERKTEKNVRHCVNSISMKFIAQGDSIPAKIVQAENKDASEADKDEADKR